LTAVSVFPWLGDSLTAIGGLFGIGKGTGHPTTTKGNNDRNLESNPAAPATKRAYVILPCVDPLTITLVAAIPALNR
jgi:hypothetical protein